MWSFGVHNLRLSSQEFWGLTLAQFDALARRYESEQRRLDYRTAVVCSVTAEIYRDRKERAKPFTPDDFMPKEESDEMSEPEMMQALDRISQMLGGKEVQT